MAIVCSLALLAPACAARSSQPAKPAARAVKEYTFPASFGPETSVCVEVYRPQLSIGCISLQRLRKLAFDLEAN